MKEPNIPWHAIHAARYTGVALRQKLEPDLTSTSAWVWAEVVTMGDVARRVFWLGDYSVGNLDNAS